MLVDSLTHVTVDGQWFGTALNASEIALREHMQKFNVSHAVLSGLLVEGCNEYVLELSKKSSGMFFAVPMLAYNKAKDVEIIVANYKNQGIRAVKIHPRFVGVSLSNAWIDTVIEICQSYKMIVFICTVDFYSNKKSVMPVSHVLAKICVRHKNTKFVLLHGGYNEILSTCEMIKQNENVIIDLSATLTRFYDSSVGLDIKYLYRKFDRKLAVGTDFPEYTYDDVRFALNHIGIQWEDAQRKGILGANLLQFLGL